MSKTYKKTCNCTLMTDMQSEKWEHAHDSLEYNKLYHLNVDKEYFLKFSKNPVYQKIQALKKENLNILEVGCGSGSLSVSLALQGHSVTTLDISEHMLAAAKQLADQASKLFEMNLFLRFIKGDIHDLSPYAHQYDIVINIALLQIWDDPKERTQLLKNLGSCLKNDGQLFVSITNTTNPFLKLIPIKSLVHDTAKCSMKTILQEVSNAKLNCISSEYLGLSETFDQWLRFKFLTYPLLLANLFFLHLPKSLQALCAPHSLVIAKRK